MSQSNTVKQLIAMKMEMKPPWWSHWFTWPRAIICVWEDEINQCDFQSSGIFCFMTTKRNSWTFAWTSGAVLFVCGWLCVHKNKELAGLQRNIHGCWSTRLGFNYTSVNMWKLMFEADFCLLERCKVNKRKKLERTGGSHKIILIHMCVYVCVCCPVR